MSAPRPWRHAHCMSTDSDRGPRSFPPWPNWITLTGLAALIALFIAIVLAYCGGEEPSQPGPFRVDSTYATPPGGVIAAPGRTTEDLTAAFRAFVMFDRNREPAWLSKVVRVRWANDGKLQAETSYPANWSDSTDPTRPAESICTNLYGYFIRNQIRWTGVQVLASDGSALVVRTSQEGSCRQRQQ